MVAVRRTLAASHVDQAGSGPLILRLPTQASAVRIRQITLSNQSGLGQLPANGLSNRLPFVGKTFIVLPTLAHGDGVATRGHKGRAHAGTVCVPWRPQRERFDWNNVVRQRKEKARMRGPFLSGS